MTGIDEVECQRMPKNASGLKNHVPHE